MIVHLNVAGRHLNYLSNKVIFIPQIYFDCRERCGLFDPANSVLLKEFALKSFAPIIFCRLKAFVKTCNHLKPGYFTAPVVYSTRSVIF